MSPGHLLALSLLALMRLRRQSQRAQSADHREGTGPSLQAGPSAPAPSHDLELSSIMYSCLFNYHHLQRMCPHYPTTDHSPWKWSPSSGPLDQLSRGLCVLSGARLQLSGPLMTPDSQRERASSPAMRWGSILFLESPARPLPKKAPRQSLLCSIWGSMGAWSPVPSSCSDNGKITQTAQTPTLTADGKKKTWLTGHIYLY